MLVLAPGDRCPDPDEPLINALIAAFDLPNVVDRTGALGTKRRDKQSHPGPNIRAFDNPALQGTGADDHSPVRIAQNN